MIDEIDLAGGQPGKELVDELVELSKTYGILTPYTSFLALEDQDITAQAEMEAVVTDNLSIVKETVGASANAQRAVKSEMKASAAPQGLAAPKMYAMDQEVAKRGVEKLQPPKQMAGRTFYFKNGQWQASDLSEKDIEGAKSVKQLSDEYFELAQKLAPEDMVWLSRTEAVIFKHEGVTYLIKPKDEA